MTSKTRGLKGTQFAALWETVSSQRDIWIAVAVLTALLLLVNLRALQGLAERWELDPNYGHGLLIPFIALYFVYLNFHRLTGLVPRRNYLGLAMVLGAMIMKFLAIPLASTILEGIAMVIMANGLVLYLGGWAIYRVLMVPGLYLFFMLPLPAPLHTAIAFPLQLFASKVSALMLQGLFSVPVRQSGNVLELASRRLSVEEACSGMRSLLGLMALGFAFAYLVQRPLWERVVLVVSTIPIAIVFNVVRVTSTALLHHGGYGNLAEGVYHTLTGYFLFLFALTVLLGLNWLMGILWVEVPSSETERRPM